MPPSHGERLGLLRRLHRRARALRSIGIAALAIALLTYIYGFAQLTGTLQSVEEICEVRHGVDYDPNVAEPISRSLFPLSQPCNATFNLVPSWVNAVVVGSLAVAIVALIYSRALRRDHSRHGDALR